MRLCRGFTFASLFGWFEGCFAGVIVFASRNRTTYTIEKLPTSRIIRVFFARCNQQCQGVDEEVVEAAEEEGEEALPLCYL